MSWGWLSDSNSPRLEESISDIPSPISDIDHKNVARDSLHQILLYQESSDPLWKRPKDLIDKAVDDRVNESADNRGRFNWIKLKDVPDSVHGEDPEWTIYSHDRNKENGNEGPVSCVKAQGLMPCSAERLFDILCTTNIEDRKKWDENIKDMDTIENFGDNLSVLYRSYKSPFMGIAGRDFIIVNGTYVSDDVLISYQTSVNRLSFKNADPKAVRGTVKAGFIVERIPGKPQECRCIRFVWLNPRGMIPNWVVQAAKGVAGTVLLKIRGAIRKDLVDRPDFDAKIVRPKKVEKDHSPSRGEAISLIQYADQRDPIRKEKLDSRGSSEWAPEVVSEKKAVTSSLEFPLPKTSSEEFHKLVSKQKQQQELKDQELSMKLQKRQMIAQKTQELNQMSESQVDQLLRTLSGIQSELQQNVEVMEKLYVEVQHEKQERKRLSELVEKQQEELRKFKVEKMDELALVHHRSLSSYRIGWKTVAMVLLWPFVTYALADFIRKRRLRR